MANGISMERVEEIIDGYDCQVHHLIAIMQDIQTEYKYLSPAVLERIAQKLNIGVAKVYSVATFYENFSLEAKGKYIIKVCDGTACHGDGGLPGGLRPGPGGHGQRPGPLQDEPGAGH